MRIFWTDGSADPNPGPGGWAVIEELDDDIGKPVAIGSAPKTTNIRMEGAAILNAIQLAIDEPCTIYTDSQFWVNVLTKWAHMWSITGWKGGKVKNLDIVRPLYKLYRDNDVKIYWVRGHAGTTLNELADHWAEQARQGAKLS